MIRMNSNSKNPLQFASMLSTIILRFVSRGGAGLAIGVVFSAALIACSSAPKVIENPCLKRRGAIDIGSGSTKAFAAVVDVCSNPRRIVEKLFDQKVKISFGESLEQSAEGTIAPEVLTDGAAKIATLAEAMAQQNLESITTIATAAFRKAKNGVEVAAKISSVVNARLKQMPEQKNSMKVQILSQVEEAELGAKSALSNLSLTAAAAPVIVWDIGGGSMQMLAVAQTPSEVFTGDLASVTFKNKVLAEIQRKPPGDKTSPNPLKKDAKKAVAMARTHAKSKVGAFFKNASKARWVGIGGVLAISVQKQVEREGLAGRTSAQTGSHEGTFFTETALAKTLDKRASRTDKEIESEYKTTEVTNLALVLGYMQELKIDKVETVEASLTQGLLTR